MKTQDTNFNPKMSSEMDICHGCGNTYRDCVCEELDAEMNEGKYPDCDPNDGYYAAPKYIDEIKLKAKVMKQSSSEPLEEKPFLTEDEELNRIFGGLEAFIGDTEIYCFYKSIIKNVIDEKLQQSNEKISSLESELKALREESNKAIEIVKSLADWSRRYPRDRVYPMNKISMDNELIELEERAKAYTLNTDNYGKQFT